MGARNALAAYHRWAGKLPPTSMLLLTFMAIVSKDSDAWPWFGQGHAALAEFAMGRENPTDSDLRAVGRAMTPLLVESVITVERAASGRSDGNSTARYRLNIHLEADAARLIWEQSPDGKRRMTDPRRKGKPPDGNRPMDNRPPGTGHRTKTGEVIGRKVAGHRTKSGEPQDGNRPTEETEDEEERENRGIKLALTTTSHPPRESDEEPPDNVVKLPQRHTGRAAQNIAEASARAAQRRAAHQAAQEAN